MPLVPLGGQKDHPTSQEPPKISVFSFSSHVFVYYEDPPQIQSHSWKALMDEHQNTQDHMTAAHTTALCLVLFLLPRTS